MERKTTIALCEFTEEEKKQMLSDIEYFYLNSRDEKVGVIGCRDTLDFFLETLGNRVYNKALDDAGKWYKKSQADLEADFYSLYK